MLFSKEFTVERVELGRQIFNVSFIKGNFRLRSGIISNEYFDKYQFESNPWILKEIAKHLVALLPVEFDILAGLETGGIPLATALSLEIGKPVVFVRKKAKDYGTMKLAEGVDIRNKTLVIVEDVVTSGGQIVESTEKLRQMGAKIDVAICVIDREQGGAEYLTKIGVELKPLFTMSYLKSIANV